MSRSILRLLTIFGIIYASLLGGVAEQTPLIGILHQVGATLVIGFWLLSLWRGKRPFPATPLDAPILAAGAVWTLSAALSREPRVSLVFAWVIWVHILIFYMLVDLMRRGQRWQRWIFEGLFMMGVMIILLTGVEMTAWYFGLSFLPQFVQSWPSLFGLSIPPAIHEAALALNFNNPTGAYCLLVIPLALAGAVTEPQRDLRWVLRGIAAGLAGVLILTKSRGAYIGFAALVGMILLLWLLQAKTRARFPAVLRPFLDPRLLIVGAILVAMAGGIVLFKIMLFSNNPDPTSFSRIDLWYAATQMFRDHPLVGVGPRQFGAARIGYLHWDGSYEEIPLKHAHSLYFNTLAEGGILGITVSIWLVVRAARVWWKGWRSAHPVRRRRLEGVLIALVAFAAHNLVDNFTQTQLMIPVLIMAAYLVAGDTALDPDPQPAEHPSTIRRKMVFVTLATLGIVQVAFIPLHLGAWRHQQALNDLSADRLTAALAAERSAQDADPWFDLYKLQEATILGQLAAEQPDLYLSQAIAAYERSLRLNSRWDVGWHNLGALYAQAGRYDEAIKAAHQAIALDPIMSGYYLKLAEYYTAVGEGSEAQSTYFEALRRQAWIASSGYWTDPAHPERTAIRAEAVTYFVPIQPETSLDIAVYSGDAATAASLVAAVVPATETRAVRARLEALQPEGAAQLCLRCYKLWFTTDQPNARYYVIWAERLWHDAAKPPTPGLTAEKAARAALFLSENNSPWSWYILAQIGEHSGLDPRTINDRLARALELPIDQRHFFPTTVYAMNADLSILPQARTPLFNRQMAEPWLQLAARYEAAHQWDDARTIYKQLLEYDPYAWDWREHLDTLPGGKTG